MMAITLYKNTNVLNIRGEKQCLDWMMFLIKIGDGIQIDTTKDIA